MWEGNGQERTFAEVDRLSAKTDTLLSEAYSWLLTQCEPTFVIDNSLGCINVVRAILPIKN